MKYEEFVCEVQAQVKRSLGEKVHIRLHEVSKNNEVILDGLSFCEEGSNVAPTIYLNDFYRDYEEGETLEEVVEEVLAIFESNRGTGGFRAEQYADFGHVKKHLACKLINREKNQNLLEQVPWLPFLDLALVAYYKVENEQIGHGTILVYKNHCKSWGITERQLFQVARENMLRILPFSFLSIGRAAGKETEGAETVPMYVLTNQSRYLGASSMIYDTVLARVGEKLQQDFWVLPSSVHECIIVPLSVRMTAEDLGRLVADVNRREVSPEDFLSDEIYFYYREMHRLMLVKQET